MIAGQPATGMEEGEHAMDAADNQAGNETGSSHQWNSPGDSAAVIERMNARRPGFLDLLCGHVAAVDHREASCTMHFEISRDYCHSVDIIQGGFVTAMLDAAMSHAAFALVPGVSNVATLEIKVSFLEPSRAGRYHAVGFIDRAGRSTGFMSGKLFTADGRLTATATTTARLVRARGGEA